MAATPLAVARGAASQDEPADRLAGKRQPCAQSAPAAQKEPLPAAWLLRQHEPWPCPPQHPAGGLLNTVTAGNTEHVPKAMSSQTATAPRNNPRVVWRMKYMPGFLG
jgi:hypothetical protein